MTHACVSGALLYCLAKAVGTYRCYVCHVCHVCDIKHICEVPRLIHCVPWPILTCDTDAFISQLPSLLSLSLSLSGEAALHSKAKAFRAGGCLRHEPARCARWPPLWKAATSVVGPCRLYECLCAMQHTATRCSTLQHTATHCSTLLHTAAHCYTLRHICDAHDGLWSAKVQFQLWELAGCTNE